MRWTEKLMHRLKVRILRFLGIDTIFAMSKGLVPQAMQDAMYPMFRDRLLADANVREQIADIMLRTPRVFGDKSRVSIAATAVINDALINTSSGSVRVEDFAFFGHNVSLITGTHDYGRRGLDRQSSVPREGRDIVVGQGAWIASNVTVLGPCRIGENAVVAAGSVVIGDVPPDAIYGGVPARFIRKIDGAETSAQ